MHLSVNKQKTIRRFKFKKLDRLTERYVVVSFVDPRALRFNSLLLLIESILSNRNSLIFGGFQLSSKLRAKEKKRKKRKSVKF